MTYGSICSGIAADHRAFPGMDCQWFSEIEKFPCAVLTHHHPDIPNHGDITDGIEKYTAADLVVGGTPCQGFSVAGKRKGLDDDRSNLALRFLEIVTHTRPRWVVWENVPGVFSTDGGRDFGAFIGELGKRGYGWAYRTLDAQYFGVPQRRRRVFVVGYLGDWRPAAAVLFERHSLQGHPTPSKEKGERPSAGTEEGPRGAGGGLKEPHMLDFEMQDRTKPDINISGALRSGSQSYLYDNHAQDSRVKQTDVAPTLNLNEGMLPLVQECSSARTYRSNMSFDQSHTSQTLLKNDVHLTISQSRVRRLSPRECERLQGFSSSFTKVPYRGKTAEECPDGPRYKALGNSIAVPVLRWIGDRIMMVEEMK